jgi:hypothetical protein
MVKNRREAVNVIAAGLKSRFENLLTPFSEASDSAKASAVLRVLDKETWPESALELQHFGSEEIKFLGQWFKTILLR